MGDVLHGVRLPILIAGFMSALWGCGGNGVDRSSDPVPVPQPPPVSAPKPPVSVPQPPPVSVVQPSPAPGETSQVLPLDEPAAATDPAAWRTEEYRASGGLGQIRAAEAYALRAGTDAGRPGGEGVTIALIDGGVDFGHPDLQGQGRTILPIGADISSPVFLSHGTKVAGTLVARRDGRGVHGVAYRAELTSIERSDNPTTAEIAAGIASAAGVARTYAGHVANPEARADILNLSFVFPNIEGDPDVVDAMRAAARSGVILVAALGNCAAHRERAPTCDNDDGSDDGLGPSGLPASLVAEEGIRGLAIAVGSLDGTGTGRALHSNSCGEAKEYCLFAPGEGIRTTDAGGRHASATGTSHAAPLVAGAAAVLEAAFPNKRADAIVARLLATARKVDPEGGGYGPDGISDIYGHGALDLAAAISPVGTVSLPVNSGSVPVSQTRFDLPSGFGAGGTSDLGQVVAYDGQGFPFRMDLGGSFRVAGTDGLKDPLQGFLSSPDPGRLAAPLHGIRGLLMVSREPLRRGFAPDRFAGDGVADYALRLEPMPGLAVTVRQGAGAPGTSNALVAGPASRGPLGGGESVAPFAAFMGRGIGFGVDWRPDADTALDFAGHEGRGYFGTGRAYGASLGAVRRIGGNLRIGARYGVLRERNAVLGIRGSGAFDGLGASAVDFVDLGVEGRWSRRVTLFGSLSRGHGRDGAGRARSLVAGWSGLDGEALTLGAEFAELRSRSDRLTLVASAPFRATGGIMHLDLPVREISDGLVEYGRRSVSLVPEGRERRFQFAYGAGTGGLAWTIGGYLRLEPGHDASARSEWGAAAKARLRF